MSMNIFEEIESDVRGYIRSFPVVFDKAKGAHLYSEDGKEYIDFFAGAGTLNYGHNNDIASKAMIQYLKDDRIVHGLDKATVAKRDFLMTFQECILKPRGLDYKLQFTGPTGTNAVEAALKLARMKKKRSNVIAFTNGYHGLTLGALAVTGNDYYRDEYYGHRQNTDTMPYDGFFGDQLDTTEYLERFLSNSSSGVDLPAAIIVETVQGEGGINISSPSWMSHLADICKRYEILLIVDDIQMGNGRTGNFFSFERAGIQPDIVCLSKAIGGGLPMSLLLIKPDIDIWKPGEHTGTFRGNNLAFCASKHLIEHYWGKTSNFSDEIARKGSIIGSHLHQLVGLYEGLQIRGIGMAWGLDFENKDLASEISKCAFQNGLLCETCGSESEVLKLLPPLIISDSDLLKGLEIFKKSIQTVLAKAP